MCQCWTAAVPTAAGSASCCREGLAPLRQVSHQLKLEMTLEVKSHHLIKGRYSPKGEKCCLINPAIPYDSISQSSYTISASFTPDKNNMSKEVRGVVWIITDLLAESAETFPSPFFKQLHIIMLSSGFVAVIND